MAQADALVNEFAAVLGLGRLRCIHLNDSKVPFGAGRDRHQNLGQGTIGSKPLRALLGQPDLQDVPAVLEVPGVEGKGPGAADLAVARRLHAQGLSVRNACDTKHAEPRASASPRALPGAARSGDDAPVRSSVRACRRATGGEGLGVRGGHRGRVHRPRTVRTGGGGTS